MQQYVGMRLGGYQIVEQIGQGGMATVCKAYQPSMDRYVAIKILPSHFTEDESFVGRFTQEARTLARLEHPHILPVHDYGEQEGITYLVMRYVEAGTLKDLITQRGPIELKEAARIVSQMAGALECGHSQGVIHRDVKPSNVLIDQQGNTFLTDFGIAKLVAETAQFTASGAVIGTPAYMAPEQGMGQPVDARCDIYSLGVVLYELVTGRVPFQAETPLAVLLKHVNAPLPPPRQIKPDLPAAVERVILKAMTKSPDDRYQTARELAAALERAVAEAPDEHDMPMPPEDLNDETVLKPAPSPLPPVASAQTPPAAAPAPSRRTMPWLPIAAAVAVLSVLLVVALLVLPQMGDGEATATSTQAEPTATAALASTATQFVAAAEQSVTPAQPTVPAETEPPPSSPTALPAEVSLSPGWTSWGNANFVSALARQDETVWAGSESGLVRWDLTDGSYTELGFAEGLVSTHINDLLVTEEGVLWVATDAGINRLDGETWVTFDEVDGLDSGWIQTLHQDATGGLWAGSEGGDRGLNYYDGLAWGPPPLPALPVDAPDVHALASSPAGDLYVGLLDEGLAAFDGEAWTLFSSEDGLPGQHILALMWTEGTLWVSSDGVVRLDPQTGEVEVIPQLRDLSIYAMCQTGEGELWFGGEDGAMRFQPATGDWQQFEPAPGALPTRPVTDILSDEDGLWFSTYGDGTAFSDDGGRWDTWSTDDELGGNVIEAIEQDQDGAMWFTHPGTGLSRYVPQGEAWQSFGEAEGALNWPSVPALDGEGNLWIGDYGELARYDGQGWQRFSPPELADLQIYAIEIGRDGVQWMVTDDGLMRHDPAADSWTTFTGADHPILEDIWSILVSRDGTVWAGGEEGLIHYDGSAWSTPEASGDAPQYVDDLAEAPDGTLWIAADGNLVHLADGHWSYFTWPTEGWLERVAVGPDGIVWVGHDGLGRYDPATGDWQVFGPADGLAHPTVLAIDVTPEGGVWVGTAGGVSRYVPPDD